MCGATQQQTDISDEQSAFYAEMTKEAQATYGASSAITSALTSQFTPILQAGPNQEGFSTAEKTALNTQATEGVASGYSQASEALGEKLGASGGGDSFLPSGAQAELQQNTANTAAGQLAEDKNTITNNDYETGRQNWTTAASVLGQTASTLNPANFANAATGSGSAAANTANQIAQANNSVWTSAIGALGGIAGTAAGNIGYSGGSFSYGGQ
jgi:hypothetical protein